MSNELPNKAQSIFRLMSTLPPPKGLILPDTHSVCVSCKRHTHILDFPVYDSGVIKTVSEPLCKLCISTYEECSKFVCCKCKMVMGWVDPHKDSDGFIFKKGHSYHIEACPNCTSGILKADLIEKIIYLHRKQKGLI